MDKETQEVVAEGEAVGSLLSSNGWKVAKARLEAVLTENASILGLDTKDLDPQKLVIELSSRQLAVGMVREWLDDLEGLARQTKAYTDSLKDDEADYIDRT